MLAGTPSLYRNPIQGHQCHPECQPMPGRCVCVCDRKEVTALPAAFLQWWVTYVQTQTNEASPRNFVANSPSGLHLSGESRLWT